MMQEHPFFSDPFVYFGKPIHEDEEEELLDQPWTCFPKELNPHSQTQIGLFLIWPESGPSNDADLLD